MKDLLSMINCDKYPQRLFVICLTAFLSASLKISIFLVIQMINLNKIKDQMVSAWSWRPGLSNQSWKLDAEPLPVVWLITQWYKRLRPADDTRRRRRIG